MRILRNFVLSICFCVLADSGIGQVSRPRTVPIQDPSQSSPGVIVSQNPSVESAKPLGDVESSKKARLPFFQDIIIVGQKNQPLLKRTSSVRPSSKAGLIETFSNFLPRNSVYETRTTQLLLNSIRSKLGIPYRYGADGPNYYDCSGFVWSVFRDAGISFERTSARVLWEMSEPVSENEKYRFGTLVFFNRLDHVGIVADEKGFYHASRSKGIVYSHFDGYWSKRIVGFRRLKVFQPATSQTGDKNKESQREIKIENQVILR